MKGLACGKQQWRTGGIDTMLRYEPHEVSDGFECLCGNGHANDLTKQRTKEHTQKNEPAIT
jgi:hypothetical protein